MVISKLWRFLYYSSSLQVVNSHKTAWNESNLIRTWLFCIIQMQFIHAVPDLGTCKLCICMGRQARVAAKRPNYSFLFWRAKYKLGGIYTCFGRRWREPLTTPPPFPRSSLFCGRHKAQIRHRIHGSFEPFFSQAFPSLISVEYSPSIERNYFKYSNYSFHIHVPCQSLTFK